MTDPGFAHSVQASVTTSRGLCKRRREQDLTIEPVAKFFDSNHFVNRGSNHREIKPVNRAHVAVQHFANVQSDINVGKRQACRFTFQIASLQVGRRLNGGVEGAAASNLLIRLIERYRRQHRIADKFEDMASARPQRGRQSLKDIVQHMNNFRSGRHVADPREAAQISVPKHRE
jgi:hypothetical protein